MRSGGKLSTALGVKFGWRDEGFVSKDVCRLLYKTILSDSFGPCAMHCAPQCKRNDTRCERTLKCRRPFAVIL